MAVAVVIPRDPHRSIACSIPTGLRRIAISQLICHRMIVHVSRPSVTTQILLLLVLLATLVLLIFTSYDFI